MKTLLMTTVTAATLLLGSGCAPRAANEYGGVGYDRIKEASSGVVVDHRDVVVRDDGSGQFLGTLIGAVIGSTLGGGRGRPMTLFGGAIVGGVIGSEAGRANAEELTVQLDDGRSIVVVVKGSGMFMSGDRVRIVTDGRRVENVQRIPNDAEGR